MQPLSQFTSDAKTTYIETYHTMVYLIKYLCEVDLYVTVILMVKQMFFFLDEATLNGVQLVIHYQIHSDVSLYDFTDRRNQRDWLVVFNLCFSSTFVGNVCNAFFQFFRRYAFSKDSLEKYLKWFR